MSMSTYGSVSETVSAAQKLPKDQLVEESDKVSVQCYTYQKVNTKGYVSIIYCSNRETTDRRHNSGSKYQGLVVNAVLSFVADMQF